MTIDQLSQLLDEIKGYVDDYRVVKNENTRLKEEAVEKDNLVASLQSSIEFKDTKISELETKISELETKISELETKSSDLVSRVAELEGTANLNLEKAQQIVNELKGIINA